MRTGIANLPLHPGRCPKWLFPRMRKLGGAISEAVILEHGQDELLKRLSDPYWFQAFGNVLGFDWHSSGLTTTVCGALKEALNSNEIGIKVAGGKGKTSRKAPNEIESIGSNFNISSKKIGNLKNSSKLSAKVDNSAVQDSYQLYHHIFVITEKGKWTVIQQGMNSSTKYARRYHWLSDDVKSFLDDPHSAVCCDQKNKDALNLASRESKETREVSLDLIKDNPKHLRKYFLPKKQSTLNLFTDSKEKILNLPQKHRIKMKGKINFSTLQKAYEIQPENYEELLSVRGIGPKTVRALALISELIYGTESSWRDPVKYSFAHGGKDGHPYPVNKERYDKSVSTLKESIEQAKIGKKERLKALKRLNL